MISFLVLLVCSKFFNRSVWGYFVFFGFCLFGVYHKLWIQWFFFFWTISHNLWDLSSQPDPTLGSLAAELRALTDGPLRNSQNSGCCYMLVLDIYVSNTRFFLYDFWLWHHAKKVLYYLNIKWNTKFIFSTSIFMGFCAFKSLIQLDFVLL